MRKIDSELPRLEAMTREAIKQIGNNEAALQQILPQAADSAVTATGVDFSLLEFGDADSLAEKLARLGNFCDRCFVFYDAIVENTRDESVLHTAQRLASSALDRIGVLKQAG